MKKEIQVIINGRKLKGREGQTILELAQENGIEIPELCFHPDLEIKASCRLCLVEIKNKKDLQPSCATKIEQGMEVVTESSRIKRARKTNLELIFSQHCEECQDCVWSFNCRLLELAKKYNVKTTRFRDRKKGFPCYQFGPAIFFDSSKCIDCRNCIDACETFETGFLELEGRGDFTRVVPSKNPKKDCIFCGQCILHCPVGAFEAVGEFEEVEKPLQEKDKIVVFQFAPAIRTSIGEEFGLVPGSILTGQLAAGIKKLGVDKVFDTSVGADFTTFEEAGELIEKINSGKGPCISSCCPSWVKFVELYYPEFIPNLATTRSPQTILGGLIKTYWAEKEKIDPKKIVVVSVMPCTAKKYEIRRPELAIKGVMPVDYVLTTRELAYLFKKHKIDLKNIKPEKIDDPFGFPSGAGVIYGATGGVAESAMRTAYAKMTNGKNPKIEFKKVRGQEGIKKAEIKLGSQKLKIAVVTGLVNARKMMEEVKRNPSAFCVLEVMACPGGCIGGGGQPLPTDGKIRAARAKSLYEIDVKKEVRMAHENPIVKKIYQEFLTNKEIIHKICHTGYSPKKKEVRFK